MLTVTMWINRPIVETAASEEWLVLTSEDAYNALEKRELAS